MHCSTNKLPYLITLLFSAFLFAGEGTIEITGQGEASSPPEFVSNRILVTSICYDSSRGAKEANAELSNKLVTILNRYVREDRDKVTATGGHNVRQTEYVSDGTNTPRILCERGWRTTNLITLETGQISLIPEIQDLVLEAIDKAEAVDPSKVNQTYAEMMFPNFHLYSETKSKIRKIANGNAWADAQSQLEAFLDRCEFKNLQLKSMAEPTYTRYPAEKEIPFGLSGGATPIIPDSITVRASWKLLWTFEQTPRCKR